MREALEPLDALGGEEPEAGRGLDSLVCECVPDLDLELRDLPDEEGPVAYPFPYLRDLPRTAQPVFLSRRGRI